MIFVNRTADALFGAGFLVDAAGAPEGRDQLVVTASEADGFVHQCPPISEDGAWEPFDDDAKKAVADAVAALEAAKAEAAAVAVTELGVASEAASVPHDALAGAAAEAASVATPTVPPSPAIPTVTDGPAESPPEPTGEAGASTEGTPS